MASNLHCLDTIVATRLTPITLILVAAVLTFFAIAIRFRCRLTTEKTFLLELQCNASDELGLGSSTNNGIMRH